MVMYILPINVFTKSLKKYVLNRYVYLEYILEEPFSFCSSNKINFQNLTES